MRVGVRVGVQVTVAVLEASGVSVAVGVVAARGVPEDGVPVSAMMTVANSLAA